MKLTEDRRAPDIRRVPITTLVDICTQSGEISAFQAESANVSGRGMSVSTSHLPEIGEELVCRFHQDEQEILVEGRVAWRSEGIDSGEFGIQFTALDADSAHILQDLGESVAPPSTSSQSPVVNLAAEEHEDEEREFLGGGERVKLHIDGLGAPMKACVHDGSARKLRVGSSLEFLKMGRALQIEDLDGGQRRGAHVDMVNVVINPTTSVPELVVQLRYEGVTPTPAPTKAGVDYEDTAFSLEKKGSSRGDVDLKSEEDEEFSDEDPAPWQPAAEALRARLGGAMSSAGQAAQKASGLMSTVANSARASMSTAVQKRAQGGKSRKSTPMNEGMNANRRRQTTRRQSRSAPSYLRSGIHEAGLAGKHRPVGQTRGVERAKASPAPRRRMRAAAIFGAAFVVLGVSAAGLRSFGGEQDAPSVSAEKKATAAVKSSTEAPKAAAASPKVQKKKAEPTGVVAEVPLFGPQAMAKEAPPPAISSEDEVALEKRAAAEAVPDETWDQKPKVTESSAQKAWGNGRLYLPTVHRIRLDGVGTSFQGSVSDDGFTVVVPGRKAMESGKSIQKRDKRIAAVRSNNNARGATVKFEFRGPVPPYRVRLRQDFVEFLISAPEETVARL